MEVGKKYKYKTGTTVCECIFAKQATSKIHGTPVGIAILLDGNNIMYGVDEHLWGEYEEVIEPRKEYFNAYIPRYENRIKYQGPWDTVEDADVGIKAFSNECYYGRLIMTHHSETHVDVEFHLKRK